MNLCAQTLSSFERIGEEKAIKLFKEIGFDGMDYSMFQPIDGYFMNHDEEMMSYYRDLRAMADACKLPFRQMHAPFLPFASQLSNLSLAEKLRKYDELIPYIKKAVKVANILGVKNLVVHGNMFPESLHKHSTDDAFALVKGYYEQLLPVAQENDVTICVENLFMANLQTGRATYNFLTTAEHMNRVINALNERAGERRFAACLDFGHAGIFNNCAADMVRQLGSSLACLHVHDNDFYHDQHIMPYLGKTDIEGACRALHEINYQGDLTFECEFTVEAFPVQLLPDILRLLERVGRYLIDIAEGREQ